MYVRAPVTDPYLVVRLKVLTCLSLNVWTRKQEIPPNILTEEEASEISDADSLSIRRKVFLYEALIDKHQHPCFLLRLANVLFILKSPTMAMQLCVKVCVFCLVLRDHTPLIDQIGPTTCEKRWCYRSTVGWIYWEGVTCHSCCRGGITIKGGKGWDHPSFNILTILFLIYL